MECNVKYGPYRAKFVANVTRYAHFCSAFQLHDFLLTTYLVDSKFGEKEITINETPEWFQRAVVTSVANTLVNAMENKKYLLASVHYGTRSAGSYYNRSPNNNWLFESIKANSMDIVNDIDADGNGEHLVEVLLTKEGLVAVKDLPVEIPDEFKPKATKAKKATSGITEEELLAYLARN